MDGSVAPSLINQIEWDDESGEVIIGTIPHIKVRWNWCRGYQRRRIIYVEVDFDSDVDIRLDSKGPIQCTRMFCAFAYNLYQLEALYDVDAGIGDH